MWAILEVIVSTAVFTYSVYSNIGTRLLLYESQTKLVQITVVRSMVWVSEGECVGGGGEGVIKDVNDCRRLRTVGELHIFTVINVILTLRRLLQLSSCVAQPGIAYGIVAIAARREIWVQY